MKKLRKQKGITLIALIITIIIMLILVGVSIQIVIESGLIARAQSAGTQTKTAYEQEGNLGEQITVGNKTYASINDYINNNPIADEVAPPDPVDPVEEEHNWTRNGDTLNCKCATCIEENAEGTTYTIGQEVSYTIVGGSATATLTGAETGVSQGLSDGILWADEKIQSDGSQTISRDESTKWVILGIENTDGVGGNETLLITTLAPTTDGLYMYGAAGYNNAVTIGETQGIFDKVCKTLYGNAARSMTMADVDNVLNAEEYGLVSGIYFDRNFNECTTGDLDTPISELGNVWTAIQNNAKTDEGGEKIYYTPEYPTGTTDASNLGKYKVDGYYYWVEENDKGDLTLANGGNNDADNTITENAKNVIFGSMDNYWYWLASRGVDANAASVGFGPGYVSGGVARPCYALFFSQGGTNNDGYLISVRAVVPLSQDLP